MIAEPLPWVTPLEADAGKFFDARPAVVRQALENRDLVLLLWGPAASGKTRCALEKVRAVALKYPGSRCLITRQVRNWLTQAALVTWEQKVLMPGDCIPDEVQTQSRSEYRFPNGSIVAVSGLDKPQRVMSSEWDVIYLQEATETAQTTMEQLVNRLRWHHVPYQQLIMDCNPTYPQHWLKRMIDSNKLTSIPFFHQDNPALFDQVKQKWTAYGEHYLKQVLESMTGALRSRLKDGRWVQAEGIVYEEWSPETHLIEPFKIPRHWNRYLSIDFGFTHPLVVQFWAEDYDGRLFMYREYFRTKCLVEDLALDIKQYLLSSGEPEPLFAICDHDPDDRGTFERHSGIPSRAAIKEVRAGIQAVKARLRPGGDQKPRLFIFRGARIEGPDKHLAAIGAPTSTEQEFEAYVWDEQSRTGDKPVDKHNHGLDALRYMVRYLDEHPVNRYAESDFSYDAGMEFPPSN